jgi:hypothetical protein
MTYYNMEDTVFAICESDLQEEAKRYLNRKLTSNELHSAVKGLESGIGMSLDAIYSAIMSEFKTADQIAEEDLDEYTEESEGI